MNVIEWTEHSTNLSPIENAWEELKRHVSNSNKKELWKNIQKA